MRLSILWDDAYFSTFTEIMSLNEDDDYTLTVTALHENGDAYDFTGTTVAPQLIFQDTLDPNNIFSVNGTVNTLSSGKFDFDLTGQFTGKGQLSSRKYFVTLYLDVKGITLIEDEEHTYETGTDTYELEQEDAINDSNLVVTGILDSVAHTFVKGTDYNLTNNSIVWTETGDVPDNDSTISVTYNIYNGEDVQYNTGPNKSGMLTIVKKPVVPST